MSSTMGSRTPPRFMAGGNGTYKTSAPRPVDATCRATISLSGAGDESRSRRRLLRAPTIGGSMVELTRLIRFSRVVAAARRPERLSASTSSKRPRAARSGSCAARAAVTAIATSRSTAPMSPTDRCANAAAYAASATIRGSAPCCACRSDSVAREMARSRLRVPTAVAAPTLQRGPFAAAGTALADRLSLTERNACSASSYRACQNSTRASAVSAAALRTVSPPDRAAASAALSVVSASSIRARSVRALPLSNATSISRVSSPPRRQQSAADSSVACASRARPRRSEHPRQRHMSLAGAPPILAPRKRADRLAEQAFARGVPSLGDEAHSQIQPASQSGKVGRGPISGMRRQRQAAADCPRRRRLTARTREVRGRVLL